MKDILLEDIDTNSLNQNIDKMYKMLCISIMTDRPELAYHVLDFIKVNPSLHKIIDQTSGKKKMNPLMKTVSRGNINLCIRLLSQGADPLIQSPECGSPIDICNTRISKKTRNYSSRPYKEIRDLLQDAQNLWIKNNRVMPTGLEVHFASGQGSCMRPKVTGEYIELIKTTSRLLPKIAEQLQSSQQSEIFISNNAAESNLSTCLDYSTAISVSNTNPTTSSSHTTLMEVTQQIPKIDGSRIGNPDRRVITAQALLALSNSDECRANQPSM